MALAFAAEGCNVSLSDVNKEGLEETAHLVGDKVKVTTMIVDVAKLDQVVAFAKDTVEKHGGVDIIVNNAGVALGDFIETVPYKDFEWLMGVNFWGVVYGTKEFLPYLKKRPEGHIVNISSINGFLPNPSNGPYVCSKFAVHGLNGTLFQELDGTNVSVTSVHPGGIATGIARNARHNRPLVEGQTPEDSASVYEKKMLKTSPDDLARAVLKGIKKKKFRVIAGNGASLLWFLSRYFPHWSIKFMNKHYRKLNS